MAPSVTSTYLAVAATTAELLASPADGHETLSVLEHYDRISWVGVRGPAGRRSG
jgi:hypothetical protein